MRRLVFITAVLVFGLTACGKDTAKNVINKGSTVVSGAAGKVTNAASCASLSAISDNYKKAQSAAKGSEQAQIAGDQFKNSLEALKAFVPSSVADALTILRSSDAPISSSDYNPSQKAARATVDNYLKDQCGKSFG